MTQLDLDVHRIWQEERADKNDCRVISHIPFCYRYIMRNDTDDGIHPEHGKHVLTRNDQRVTCKKCIAQAGIRIKTEEAA